MDNKQLLEAAGIMSPKHAKLIGMSPHIFKGAKQGKISEPWRQLLQLRAGQHPTWKGYYIREGFIITPCGDSVNKTQIDQILWGEYLAYERGKCDAEKIQRELIW